MRRPEDPTWLDDDVIGACNRLGWPRPRDAQMEVLEAIFTKRQLIAVLPTSAGKSGCYQIPALARPGLVVVVSPLVALMADQVERLKEHGVAAFQLNSHCSVTEKRNALSAISEGKADLVYMSPERMQGIDKTFFGKSKVQMFAIDEAHCISEWGHDFRPAYLRIGAFIAKLSKSLGDVQTIALTATATGEVIDEIAKVLHIEEEAVRIIKTPDRPNITYGVAGFQTSLVRMIDNARTVIDDPLPCLVYGSTRKTVEAASVVLERAGYKADFYHAGMSKEDRTRVQNSFIHGEIEVLSATCAFGMGIDHAGIRSVIHLEMPTSLEAYMQESGRAGRDGAQSVAICRATTDTLETAAGLTSLAWPTPKKVREFWHALQPEFRSLPGKWEGEGKVQKTCAELSIDLSIDERQVAACLRILDMEGFLKVVPYQDRPVVVKLLSSHKNLKGRKQREVLDNLERHSDLDGEIKGSVAFFSNVIGVDLAFLRKLNARQALRFQWVDKCQMIERLRDDAVADFNEDRIKSIRARSLMRIESCKDYIKFKVSTCRRDYLLRYFGDMTGGSSLGRCCQHCP